MRMEFFERRTLRAWEAVLPRERGAFMASYASGLAASGRLRQLPLGKALQEYAGTVTSRFC